ncbi:GGDEF domain-containing protein [Campylobacter fetus]
MAFCPDDASSFEELYERADKALYESKSKGRDRFTYYKDIN